MSKERVPNLFLFLLFICSIGIAFAVALTRVLVELYFYFFDGLFDLTWNEIYQAFQAGFIGGAVMAVGLWLLFKFKK